MAQSDNQSDLRLIALVAGGDRQAFRELNGKYQTRLTRFLFNVVRQPHIVEEVLDDTMMVVWERAGSFKGESKLSTWMFAIAYRKAIKAFRRYDEPMEDQGRDGRISTDANPEEEYERSRTRRPAPT